VVRNLLEVVAMKRIAARAFAGVLSTTTFAAAQGAFPPVPPDPPPPPPEAPPPPPPETPPPPPEQAPPAQPQQAPPQPYPYPYGYPPPGYGYPPPGYTYPPPGYSYPPPGYGYPPQYEAPRPRPKPRYPDNAAAQTSPFVDITIGGINMEQRIQHFLVLGAQAGMFLGDIVRIAPQIGLFASEPEDDFSEPFEDTGSLPSGFQSEHSESPSILWGGSVGVAVLSRQNFVLAPGVLFVRTDVADYGSFLALHAPFDWVTNDGARVGFAVGIGRSFGGSVRGTCFDTGFNPPECDPGEKREFDREAGAGFYAHFQLGWGFNHPEPLKPAE
jgi:hypothetical protein